MHTGYVDVYLQINAWVDAEVNMQWTGRHTLHNGLGDEPLRRCL